jgi:dienelactone hydrolase
LTGAEIEMKNMAIILILCALPSLSFGEPGSNRNAYKDGETLLEGYLAFDEHDTRLRPAILVVHDWMGLGAHYRAIADRLAKMGFAAFAVDMYGEGVRPSNAQQAAGFAKTYKSDRELMRRRILAALEHVKSFDFVDRSRIGAIGYCFGGTVVLELARSGADVRGVVSFHGGLETPVPVSTKTIRGGVLVLHGADDPLVPPEEVAGFQREMRAAGVDWQMVYYANAVHSFTNPAAGNDNSKGVAYNERADKRSWVAMESFFRELFQRSAP